MLRVQWTLGEVSESNLLSGNNFPREKRTWAWRSMEYLLIYCSNDPEVPGFENTAIFLIFSISFFLKILPLHNFKCSFNRVYMSS